LAGRTRWRCLRKRLAVIRPEYVGVDPVDRTVYEPGQIAQCDLWFPETRVPVGHGQQRVLPVLVMTLGFSRFMIAVMIPSRQAPGHAEMKTPGLRGKLTNLSRSQIWRTSSRHWLLR